MRLTAPTAGMIIEDSAYACATCRDRGWRMFTDGDQERLRRCWCRSPRTNLRLVREIMEGAGMRADEIKSAFSSWDTGHQARPKFARAWLEQALAGADADVVNPWCFTLLGKTGRGKTMTAATLVRIYIQAGGPAPLWVRVPEGFKQTQAERRSDAYLEDSALETRIKRAGLCVFDDYGTEERNQDLMESVCNEWLSVRQRRHALSVVTCNAETISGGVAEDGRELKGLGAPRIESRLAEGVYRLLEAETDYRDKEAR